MASDDLTVKEIVTRRGPKKKPNKIGRERISEEGIEAEMELLKKRKVYEKLEGAYSEQYNKWIDNNKDAAFTPAVGNLPHHFFMFLIGFSFLYVHTVA